MTDTAPAAARIRSFVRRQGRMTAAQRRAFDAHWARWGLQRQAGVVVFESLFPGARRLVLEVGFGMGETLLQMALAEPDSGFVGIDVHRPGVGRLLRCLDQQQIGNVRVYCDDAVDVLESCIPAMSLDAVLLLFPDPWPKKRHHKRRILTAEFAGIVRDRLKPEGLFYLATDWADYAQQMMQVLSQVAGLRNRHGSGAFAPRPPARPPTKFERRGNDQGHEVWDLLFERCP